MLVPSCSRAVEPGMVVHTRSPRVMLARKLVLELLASSVDLSTAPGMARICCAEYELRSRALRPRRRRPRVSRSRSKIDNDLYVRDYGKCVLCYKCVEACGPDHQNTFAIAVAGRGFDARISTEFAVPLPDSACVYCGNCIAVCPTGALMASREYELRKRGAWDEVAPDDDRHDLPVLRRRLHADACTCRTARSSRRPRRSTTTITAGNLCIKGRFGWRFVEHPVETRIRSCR